MPLPFVNFRPLTAEDAGSGMGASKRFIDMLGQLGQNKQTNIQNEYLPQNLAAQLKQMQIQNLLLGAKVPYAAQNEKTAAQMAVENLLGKRQENKWYGPKAQSDIGLQGAQTALAQQDAKYKGLESLISATNATRNSGRFGEMYNLSRALSQMPAATRDSWIAEHQDEYTSMVNTLADKSMQAQENQGQGLLQQQMAKMFGSGTPNQQTQGGLAQTLPQNNGMPQTPPGMPLKGNFMEQMNQLLKGEATLGEPENPLMNKQQQPLGQNPNTPFSNKPVDKENAVLATKMSANNRNITAAMKNRVDSAITFDKWIEDNKEVYAPRIENALKYSGIKGRGKQYVDKFIKSESPESYQDLKWFRRSFVPNAINQVKMMERMGATDSQREEMQGMIDSVADLDLDPKSAKKIVNELFATMQDISRSVVAAGEPLYPGVRRKLAGLSEKSEGNYLDSKSSINEEDLKHTAEKYGITIEEVRKRLGAK